LVSNDLFLESGRGVRSDAGAAEASTADDEASSAAPSAAAAVAATQGSKERRADSKRIISAVDDMLAVAKQLLDKLAAQHPSQKEQAVEKAHQIILKSYVLNDFHEFGLWPGGGESYPMMIINEGWSAFDFFGTWDWRQFNIQMADNGAGNYERACRDG
jgi:hypothetical protein